MSVVVLRANPNERGPSGLLSDNRSRQNAAERTKMKFRKFGSYLINMELVTHVITSGPWVNVFVNSAEPVVLDGTDGEEFLAALGFSTQGTAAG